jgi:malonyl-CoA O-methyltransferase
VSPATGTNSTAFADSRHSPKPAFQPARIVSVIEGHAQWARTYDLTPNPLLALEERILEFLLPGLRDKFVVDVACGTGRWLQRLKAQGARGGLGIDLSAEMLSQASLKPGLTGTLARGDARALPLRDGAADLAISSFAVGYIDDLRGLARELARVARPGGVIIVSDFHPSNHARRWRRTFRLGGEVLEIRNIVRPVAEICAEFEASGLKLEACLEPCFDEAERHFFDQCGRSHFFEEARSGAVIFVCVFKRAPEASLQEP